jgi:hypothetical protein
MSTTHDGQFPQIEPSKKGMRNAPAMTPASGNGPVDASHSPQDVASEAGNPQGSAPDPNIIEFPEGAAARPDNGEAAPIPDPGDDPVSEYVSRPNFVGMQGIKRKTTIILRRPRNYFRSLFSMADSITLIDASRADAPGKDLWLIVSKIANDEQQMHDVSGAFNAFAVPCYDRHSIPQSRRAGSVSRRISN